MYNNEIVTLESILPSNNENEWNSILNSSVLVQLITNDNIEIICENKKIRFIDK